MKLAVVIGALCVALIIAAQFVTVFVIQPIGALPEGRTVVISRLTTMNFVDSADAWCERKMSGVSLLCRMAVIARVSKESTVLLRLPYSDILYKISTNGKTYDR
ncbi:MAG: hypothetical protein HZA68_09910 [Rhodovulum sp.]|nr:hypothetical protein [Rhodovulum sp.]